MKTLIYLFTLLTLLSCKSNKPLSSLESKTVIIEKQTDTVVYTRPDSASSIALLKCDSVGNVLLSQITGLKTGRSSTASIRVKDNFIFLDCKVDSMAVYLAKHREFKSVTDTSATIVTVYKDKPKGKLEAFVDNLLIVLAGIALGIGIMLFMLKKIWN